MSENKLQTWYEAGGKGGGVSVSKYGLVRLSYKPKNIDCIISVTLQQTGDLYPCLSLYHSWNGLKPLQQPWNG